MDARAITLAGLEVLDELGFEGFTMRAVATKLDVQVGGLYYHFPDKAQLVQAMTDELCSRMVVADPVGDWHTQAVAQCRQMRRSMLEVRDGARLLVTGPFVGSAEALQVFERLLTILASGVEVERLGIAGETLVGYIIGYVLQEQASAAIGPEPLLAAISSEEHPTIAGQYGVIPADDRFTTAIEAIIAGFEK